MKKLRRAKKRFKGFTVGMDSPKEFIEFVPRAAAAQLPDTHLYPTTTLKLPAVCKNVSVPYWRPDSLMAPTP